MKHRIPGRHDPLLDRRFDDLPAAIEHELNQIGVGATSRPLLIEEAPVWAPTYRGEEPPF